ncbi:MAG: GNAT family N-acetyltransferase [Gemmatimonadaceae bacterium]
MKGVTVRSMDPPAESDREAIIDGLLGYNAERGVPWMGRDLAVVAWDKSGAVIGGLLGQTNIGWLFVAALWVAAPYRGRGVGSALLAEAEREARRRDCIGVYLDTYSFQARPFYERLGYELFGTLPDCPPGGAKYYLYKRLSGVRAKRTAAKRGRRMDGTR